MGADEPLGPNFFRIRNIQSSCIFFMLLLHYKPMKDNDGPGAWPVWTPGTRLAGFIKGTFIHSYTENMKALGLVVLEKKIFLCFYPL